MRVVEQLAHGLGERLDVARRDDAAGPEAANRLAEAADVVGDGRHAGAERAHERAALVDLGPVGEERDRRLAERAVDLVVREVAEPPLGPVARGRPVAVDRLERIAGDQEPRSVDLPHDLDRVSHPLVGADDPEAEKRPPVVAPLRVAREDRVRDDAEPGGIGQLGQLVAPALAVDDDPLEAAEEPPPEVELRGGAARQQVVRGEDERRTLAKQPVVELRRGEPLDVGDVGAAPAEAGKPERMLDELDRDAEARAAKESGADRIEELAAPVAVRLAVPRRSGTAR